MGDGTPNRFSHGTVRRRIGGFRCDVYRSNFGGFQSPPVSALTSHAAWLLRSDHRIQSSRITNGPILGRGRSCIWGNGAPVLSRPVDRPDPITGSRAELSRCGAKGTDPAFRAMHRQLA
jgi:hypothetical protein